MSSENLAVPSDATRRPSRPMQLVSERHLEDPSPPSPTSPTTTATSWTSSRDPFPDYSPSVPDSYRHKVALETQAWKHGVLGALNLAARVLAVRFILLVAVIGAFLLTWQTLADPQMWRVIATLAFTALTVLPAVWLSAGHHG